MGGFFGTIQHQCCVNDLFYGTDYNSHLGTRRGGMAGYSPEGGFSRSIHNLENAYFRSKFEGTLDRFQHCTSGIGVISDTDPQPLVVNSHLGRFALCTVAKIGNMEQLSARMLDHKHHFAELSSGRTSQTELVALLICEAGSFVEGIENVYRMVEGSCSMLLLTEQGLICARDRWGRTPIVIGQKAGAMAATSETTAFPNLDFQTTHFVGPGEVVRLTADGMEQLRAPEPQMQVCSFLWVYYGFPTSSYEGRNVEEVRYRSGQLMGQEDHTEGVDCVCGIPDSGVGMAFGYAQGMQRPYQRAIAKYTPTWPRSFTPSSQERRSLVAKMKLIANRDMLRGKSIVFCDDSIVRGTQLRDNVKVLFDEGLRQAHMRIACPPLIYGCPYIGFTSSKSDMELITRRIIGELEGDPNKDLELYATTGSPQQTRLIEIIRERLGLTTLRFNTLEHLVEAIGLPKCKLCTHCFDGTGRGCHCCGD